MSYSTCLPGIAGHLSQYSRFYCTIFWVRFQSPFPAKSKYAVKLPFFSFILNKNLPNHAVWQAPACIQQQYNPSGIQSNRVLEVRVSCLRNNFAYFLQAHRPAALQGQCCRKILRAFRAHQDAPPEMCGTCRISAVRRRRCNIIICFSRKCRPLRFLSFFLPQLPNPESTCPFPRTAALCRPAIKFPTSFLRRPAGRKKIRRFRRILYSYSYSGSISPKSPSFLRYKTFTSWVSAST